MNLLNFNTFNRIQYEKVLDPKRYIYFYLAICGLLGIFTIYFFNGNGDDSDSVAHYLFAKYAPFQVELYVDHWAKPVFVLLASPFAQFGFNGLKFFNLLVTLFTILFTYHIAFKLNKVNAHMVAVFMMVSPLYYILTFSALTEPLFALFLALGILWSLQEKYVQAAILLSFLPYVRSEGLIILAVFLFYLVLKQKWKAIPFLISGSLLYGFAGYFVYQDVFWVFTKIPYATLSSVYGSGSLFHYAEHLVNVLGVPVYALFLVGLIYNLILCFKSKLISDECVLIFLAFMTFFIAHSLFWYLGIFNSMGLKRVFLAVMPIMAIIALNGYNFILEGLSGRLPVLKKILPVLLMVYLCLFPFTSNPSAIQWKKDMMLSEKQELAKQTAVFIQSLKKEETIFWYNNYYLSMVLNRNHFNGRQRKDLRRQELGQQNPGELLIWDKRYAEQDIELADLNASSHLKVLFVALSKEHPGDTVFAVYESK